MPAKAKLTAADLKKIHRRVQAGAQRSELALAYGVNRKTIWRRLKPLELAEAGRARQSEVGGKPARAPEQARTSAIASPSSHREPDDAGRPASATGPWRTSDGRRVRFHPDSYEAWLDEHDARVPAPPDPRVRLVTESGRTVGSTCESNAERMAAVLAPRHGPLRVVPE
jgi:hypothetical protein